MIKSNTQFGMPAMVVDAVTSGDVASIFTAAC